MNDDTKFIYENFDSDEEWKILDSAKLILAWLGFMCYDETMEFLGAVVKDVWVWMM